MAAEAVSGSRVIINGGGGDDILTIDIGDNSTPFPKEIVFNGGPQRTSEGDALVLDGTAEVEEVSYVFFNKHDGTIDISGQPPITYSGLEPVTQLITGVFVQLYYSAAPETITVGDISGWTQVSSSSAESVSFPNPTGILTIHPGNAGANVVQVLIADIYPANINILDSDADNTVELVSLLLGDNKNIDVTADTIKIQLGLKAQGAGDITLDAANLLSINETAVISEAGDINLSGGGSASSDGIRLIEAEIRTEGHSIFGFGDITLMADSIGFYLNTITPGGNFVRGGGALAIKPKTPGTSIGLGGGSGTLNLDDTELAALVDGFSQITIGDTAAGTGIVDINTASFNDPVQISGGTIKDHSGTDINAGTNKVTLDGKVAPGQSPGILNVNGAFVLPDGNSLDLEFGGATPGEGTNNHDQVNVTGTVSIGANVALNTTAVNGYTPRGGESLLIINNDGADAISGIFNGLPEGSTLTNFLGSGFDYTISYIGGDGNDIAISGDPTAVSLQSFEAGATGRPWLMPAAVALLISTLLLLARRGNGKKGNLNR